MPVDDVVTGATTEGIPVAPSMGPTLEAARVPTERALVDQRVVLMSASVVELKFLQRACRAPISLPIPIFRPTRASGPRYRVPPAAPGAAAFMTSIPSPQDSAILSGFGHCIRIPIALQNPSHL